MRSCISLIGSLTLLGALLAACTSDEATAPNAALDAPSGLPPADAASDAPDQPGPDGVGASGDADTAAPPRWAIVPADGAAPPDWCDPAIPPDAACFAARRDASSDPVGLAREIGDKILATHPAAEGHWDWGDAVMMLGLSQLARITGDTRYRDYYRAWLDHHIDAGYTIWSSDTCAPAALAVALIADGFDEPRYHAVVDDALHYLAEEALRTPEGGLNHLGTEGALGISLWADSLFMFGNVLTGWGEASGDVAALDAYAEQFEIFTDLLQEDGGFYKHAAHAIFEQTDGVYWARANGWIAAAGADHLRVRRNRGEAIPEMEAALHRLLDAALATQDPDTGLWWTVPNRPGETYLETSASALFAYALARGYRTGWLDAAVLPAVRATLRGIESTLRLGSDGWLVATGISGPTNVGPFEYYASVELKDDALYGLGAILLALTEASGLPGMDPTAGLTEVPIEPSPGFSARRAALRDLCLQGTGATAGSLYGQVCRVAAGLSDLNDSEIDAAIAKLAAREDTADFRAAGLVRLLYLDDATGALGADRRAAIGDALLAFRYWLDEPGEDGMAFWTENHQILFHSAELLAGQRWPDTVFANSGATGAEHMAHALPRLHRWLDLRGRYGFSEWHSNVYYNEDIPALLNLWDFAEDPEIRTKAGMVLDILGLDLLHNSYRGLFATTHGRTYPSKYIGGLNDSTREFAGVTLGLGQATSGDNFSGSFLVTSTYVPPPLLEDLAEATRERHEHRQRDSFDVAHGPAVGVSYEGLDDTVIWAGLAALVAPDVILGASVVLEQYHLWSGFLFGDLPPDILGLLRGLAGTPGIVDLAKGLEPISLGMALEGVDTYVYRTPHYQLAGAQDFKPGMWGPQTLIWQATLDEKAFAIATYPGGIKAPSDIGVTVNDPWTGGWYPRATLYRNVGVIQYRQKPVQAGFESLVSGDFIHAWVPRSGFDEVRTEGHWVLGRKGSGYLALWSEVTPTWVDGTDGELRVDAKENVYVVELGSTEEHADFDHFVAAILAAEVSAGAQVRYLSPTVGQVEVRWTGPMTVAGTAVPLGPHRRWDDAFHTQRNSSRRTTITRGERTLDLDFARARRRLLAPAR